MNKNCSFCNAEDEENNRVLLGEDANICMSCASSVTHLITANIAENNLVESSKNNKLLSPKQFKENLDKYVISQDAAKKILAVAVYNHIKRVENSNLNISKSNVLMIGPSGSGKTFLAETIAKQLDIPLAIVNTTSLTAAGYIGEDVSSVLERLWKNAGEDVEKAQKGIIFLDEIDKNAASVGGTNNKDVSGKAVQQELLKILEGDVVKIYPEGSNKNRKSGTPIEIDTSNILFIAGGAFVGLKRKSGVQITALGKQKEKDNIDNIMMQELLNNYGIIPEFYGRFPNIVELEELSIESIENIITKPENNISKQYKDLFKLSNVDLSFSKKFIDKVANEALEIKTGARGIKTIMEDMLVDVMFDIEDYSGKNITLDYNYNKVKVKINAT